MGFVVSIPRKEIGKPDIEIHTILEYLTFDTKKGTVNVCGDFITTNHSDNPEQIYVLHQGDVDFQAATNGWSNDDLYTKILKEQGHSHTCLQIKGDGLIQSQGWDAPIEVRLLQDPKELERWEPNHAPFTGIKSPILEPGSHSLFRIVGETSLDSYQAVTQDPRYDLIESLNQRGIVILAGKPLIYEIDHKSIVKQELRDTGQSLYFNNKRIVIPEYHLFFLEFKDGSPLEIVSRSTDISEESSNVAIDNRKITQLYSDRDWIDYVNDYGPIMSIIKQPAKTQDTKKRSNVLTGVF